MTPVPQDDLEQGALLVTLVSVAILDRLAGQVQMEMLAVQEHRAHLDPSGCQGNKVKQLSCKMIKALSCSVLAPYCVTIIDVISLFLYAFG